MTPTGQPPRTERRAFAARWSLSRDIRWRVRGGRKTHHGQLVERSLNGMVIRAPRAEIPQQGAWLFPADHETSVRNGFRSVLVVRTEQLRGDQCRAFVHILG